MTQTAFMSMVSVYANATLSNYRLLVSTGKHAKIISYRLNLALGLLSLFWETA
jgi:hypothetical protein